MCFGGMALEEGAAKGRGWDRFGLIFPKSNLFLLVFFKITYPISKYPELANELKYISV